MPSVLDKLVNDAAMNDGSRPLLRTHEIDQKQHEQTAE
jgi:hypothetical protein